MQLIGTLRECWAFWSVRFALLQTGVIGLWATFPWPSEQADSVFKGIVWGLNGAILLSRVIKQQTTTAQDLQAPKKP